jgi:uncharacterized repeat protein (TIGR03803 family)
MKIKFTLPGLGAVVSLLMSATCPALEPQTLFNFQVSPGTVAGALVQGPDGNFYGTSQEGGTNGQGVVFRVTPRGVVTRLVSFDGSSVGGFPIAGLVNGPPERFHLAEFRSRPLPSDVYAPSICLTP